MTIKNSKKNISAEPGDIVLDVTSNTLTTESANSNYSEDFILTITQQDFINETNQSHYKTITIPASELVRLAYLEDQYYDKQEIENIRRLYYTINEIKANYYDKTETDSKIKIHFDVRNSLPSTSSAKTNYIYLIPFEEGDADYQEGAYREYVYLESQNTFEMIGSTKIDLSPYLKLADLNVELAKTTNFKNLKNNVTTNSNNISSLTTSLSNLIHKFGFDEQDNEFINFALFNNEYWFLTNAIYDYDNNRFVKLNNSHESLGVQIKDADFSIWRSNNRSSTTVPSPYNTAYNYTTTFGNNYIGALNKSTNKWENFNIPFGWENVLDLTDGIVTFANDAMVLDENNNSLRLLNEDDYADLMQEILDHVPEIDDNLKDSPNAVRNSAIFAKTNSLNNAITALQNLTNSTFKNKIWDFVWGSTGFSAENGVTRGVTNLGSFIYTYLQNALSTLESTLMGEMNDAVDTHNTSPTSHNDIRQEMLTFAKASDVTNIETNLSSYVKNTDTRLTDSRSPKFILINASSTSVEDLNDYNIGGFYYCSSDTNIARYIINAPNSMGTESDVPFTNNKSFFLLIETWGTSSNFVKQTLTYYNTNITYTRIKKGNNGWTDWEALSKDGHTHSQYLTTSQLSSATNSESTSDVATSKAVFDVYTLANSKPSLGTTSTTAATGNHGHGSITTTGTINSNISSIKNIVVTNANHEIKTIAKLPLNSVTHQDISGKIDTAGAGLEKSGTTLGHSNSITQETTGVFKKIKFDGQGHITGLVDVTANDLPNSIPTSKISGLATVATSGSYNHLDHKPEIPTANSTDTNIKEDGLRSAGRLSTFAKADHIHPVHTAATLKMGTTGTDASTSIQTAVNNLKTTVGAKVDTAGAGLTKSTNTSTGAVSLAHLNSITAQNSTALKKIKFDGQGHINGVAAVTTNDLPQSTALSNIGTLQNATQATINSNIDGIVRKYYDNSLHIIIMRNDDMNTAENGIEYHVSETKQILEITTGPNGHYIYAKVTCDDPNVELSGRDVFFYLHGSQYHRSLDANGISGAVTFSTAFPAGVHEVKAYVRGDPIGTVKSAETSKLIEVRTGS